MKFFQFLQTRYRTQFYVALFVFVGLGILAYFNQTTHQAFSWLDPIIGISTFLFAVFLWLNGLRKEWEESLPKRMTVQFEYDNRNIMVCKDSLLVNLSDARTWALQIGSQMSSCKELKFGTFYNFRDKGIATTEKGKKYKSYIFTYYLTHLPIPKFEGGTEEENKEKADLLIWKLNNGCLVWTPEYDEDNRIISKEGFHQKTGPRMTVAEE